MTAKQVIKFIEDRPEDFNWGSLEKKIRELSQPQLSELMERVETVCQQWLSLRVMPKGDIGIVAAYQGARDIINNRIIPELATPKAEDKDV